MRRKFMSIHPSFVVLVVSGLALANWEGRSAVQAQAQDKDKEPTAKSKAGVEGAWKMLGQTNPATGDLQKIPDGLEDTKFVTGGRFQWTVVAEGKVVATAGGTYTLKDDVYTEKVTFVGSDDLKHLLDKKFAYPIKLENGKWHLKATFQLEDREMEIDEIWERCP